MDTRIWTAELLQYSPEAITTLLIGYIPIQNVFGVKERERESAWFINQKRLKLKKEMVQMNLQNRKRLTDLENELMAAGKKG